MHGAWCMVVKQKMRSVTVYQQLILDGVNTNEMGLSTVASTRPSKTFFRWGLKTNRLLISNFLVAYSTFGCVWLLVFSLAWYWWISLFCVKKDLKIIGNFSAWWTIYVQKTAFGNYVTQIMAEYCSSIEFNSVSINRFILQDAENFV